MLHLTYIVQYGVVSSSPLAEALRWGKTYWQATSEMAERPVVDLEVDAHIEGSLAAESSLIVLDTMELLMQTIEARENLHSTLGRVRNHNHSCNLYNYKEK